MSLRLRNQNFYEIDRIPNFLLILTVLLYSG
nr:MAG TPA: hypothetical protein [Caudoviricetes sp.]